MNLILLALRNGLKPKFPEIEKFTFGTLRFFPKRNRLEILIYGLGFDGSERSAIDTLENDPDANTLRDLFLKASSKIEGEIDGVKVEMDFVNNSLSQTIFFTEKISGEKRFKKQSL